MILILNKNISISKAKFDGEIANGFFLFFLIITNKKIKANAIEFVANSFFSLQNILIKNQIEMKFGIYFLWN